MGKPTKEQMEQALAAAERLRDLDLDEDHLGRSLLYLHQRQLLLERVFEAAKHYLHGGHDEHEHARLVQAVDAARRSASEEDRRREERVDFGLE